MDSNHVSPLFSFSSGKTKIIKKSGDIHLLSCGKLFCLHSFFFPGGQKWTHARQRVPLLAMEDPVVARTVMGIAGLTAADTSPT